MNYHSIEEIPSSLSPEQETYQVQDKTVTIVSHALRDGRLTLNNWKAFVVEMPGLWEHSTVSRKSVVSVNGVEHGGHLLGRAPSRLLQVLPGGKGLPAGPSEASPCGPGGSGVGLCLPDRGDDPT